MGLMGHLGQFASAKSWSSDCRHCHHPVGVAVWQVGWHQGSQGFCQ